MLLAFKIALMHRYNDLNNSVKKRRVILIKSNEKQYNTRWNRTKITRKQKLEKKKLAISSDKQTISHTRKRGHG